MNHKVLFLITILCQMTTTTFSMDQEKEELLPKPLMVEYPRKKPAHYLLSRNNNKWKLSNPGADFCDTFNDDQKNNLTAKFELDENRKKIILTLHDESTYLGEEKVNLDFSFPIQTKSLYKLRKKVENAENNEELKKSSIFAFEHGRAGYCWYSAIPVQELLEKLNTLEKNVDLQHPENNQCLPIIHTLTRQINQLNDIIQQLRSTYYTNTCANAEFLKTLNTQIATLESKHQLLQASNNTKGSIESLFQANQRNNSIIKGLSTLSFLLFIALLYKSVNFSTLGFSYQ